MTLAASERTPQATFQEAFGPKCYRGVGSIDGGPNGFETDGSSVPEKGDTKNRILDAAEALFAEAGYDAVPIREIMRRADTRLGLMSYYFESKEALLEAVVERRVEMINIRRRQRLEQIAGTDASTVEKLVDILVMPFVEMIQEQGPEWISYAQLNAQLAQTPKWANLISRNFDGVVQLFIDELGRLAPASPKPDIVRVVVIALGSMLNVLVMSGRMKSLSHGFVRDDDLGPNITKLRAFMAGGIRASLDLPAASAQQS